VLPPSQLVSLESLLLEVSEPQPLSELPLSVELVSELHPLSVLVSVELELELSPEQLSLESDSLGLEVSEAQLSSLPE
jgi:hypothetical protein